MLIKEKSQKWLELILQKHGVQGTDRGLAAFSTQSQGSCLSVCLSVWRDLSQPGPRSETRRTLEQDSHEGSPVTLLKGLVALGTDTFHPHRCYNNQEVERDPNINTWDWTGEYGLPGSPLRRVSLFIFVFRQAMYRLQKSLQSSLTFSSSRR